MTPGLTEPPRHPPPGSPGQMNRLPTRLQLHDPTIPLRRRRRPRYLPPLPPPGTKMGDVPTQPGQTKAEMRRGASPIQRRSLLHSSMMVSSARAHDLLHRARWSPVEACEFREGVSQLLPFPPRFALETRGPWTTARDSLLVGGGVGLHGLDSNEGMPISRGGCRRLWMVGSLDQGVGWVNRSRSLVDLWFVRVSAGSKEVGWRFPSRRRDGGVVEPCDSSSTWQCRLLCKERLSSTWDGRFPLCRLSSVFAERGLALGERGCEAGMRACHLHIYTVGWLCRPIGMPPRTVRLPQDPKLRAAPLGLLIVAGRKLQATAELLG